MIHHLPIATPSLSCPCGPAQRWVAQLRCILPHTFLLLTALLPDCRSHTASPNPSHESVPHSFDHSPSAYPPPTHLSPFSPQH